MALVIPCLVAAFFLSWFPIHGFRMLKRKEENAAVPLTCTFGPVFITSLRGQQLEERRGTVGMHDDTGSYQTWMITSAGGNNVFLTSREGQQLQDWNGNVGLDSDKGSAESWTISDAGGGKAYITSLRGNSLQDSGGEVGLGEDQGSNSRWSITEESGERACGGTSAPAPSPPPSPSGTDMRRSSNTKLRVGQYNVFRSRVFNGDRVEAFKRLHDTLQADVWVMQEVSYTGVPAPTSEGDRWRDLMRKNTGDNSWDYSWNALGLYLLSKHPIAWQGNFSHRVMATWIQLPRSISSSDLVVVNVHLAPGSKSQTRRDQAALGVEFLIKVRAGQQRAGSRTIPADATLMFCGDFNSKSKSSPYKMVRSLDTGYKQDGYSTSRTEMTDAAPVQLNTRSERATIGKVAQGKMTDSTRIIDFAFFRTDSSDLSLERSFIPNTLVLDDRSLAANGVRKMDVALNPNANFNNNGVNVDHLPLVTDFKTR